MGQFKMKVNLEVRIQERKVKCGQGLIGEIEEHFSQPNVIDERKKKHFVDRIPNAKTNK